MAIHRQHIESELQVLQEAVASAVHELSQPLNVVNLLADNVLDDVASLQETAVADAEMLDGLRRRVESIVEQAAKASDITRWVRAFAVGIGGDAADFDPDAVIERVAGIFSNDLRVAGVGLVVAPAPGTRWAVGDEALFAFALTETVLWLSRVLPEPANGASRDDSPGRQIRIECLDDRDAQAVVVSVSGDLAPGMRGGSASAQGEAAAAATEGAGKVPQTLPLLALAGRASGSSAAVSKLAGGSVRVRLTLPRSDLAGDASPDGLR